MPKISDYTYNKLKEEIDKYEFENYKIGIKQRVLQDNFSNNSLHKCPSPACITHGEIIKRDLGELIK